MKEDHKYRGSGALRRTRHSKIMGSALKLLKEEFIILIYAL
jgi:hypothetical protein